MSEGKWKETIGHGFGTGRNKGEKRKLPVTNEITGGDGGYHVEHWDGRQDAVVVPTPVATRTSVNDKEGEITHG